MWRPQGCRRLYATAWYLTVPVTFIRIFLSLFSTGMFAKFMIQLGRLGVLHFSDARGGVMLTGLLGSLLKVAWDVELAVRLGTGSDTYHETVVRLAIIPLMSFTVLTSSMILALMWVQIASRSATFRKVTPGLGRRAT